MGAIGHSAKTRASVLVDDCMEAYKRDRESLVYLLQCGDERAENTRIRLLMDAGDINLLAAGYATRGSRFHRQVIELCAAINDACAESLEGAEREDLQLKTAYAASLRASASCREFLEGTPVESKAERARDQAVMESFPASDTPPTVSRA